MNKKSSSDPLQRMLLRAFSAFAYLPVTQEELLTQCKCDPHTAISIKKVLQNMWKQGVVSLYHDHFYLPKRTLCIGTLRTNPRGFGFVLPDHIDQFPGDIFVNKANLGGAVDGDIVAAEPIKHQKKDKGPEGIIVKILKRARSRFAAFIHVIEPSGAIVLYAPLLGKNKMLYSPFTQEHPLQYGDRVIVEVVDWGDRSRPVLCHIKQYLGSIYDASIDTSSAIEEFQIKSVFPEQTLQQARQYGKTVTKKDRVGRVDFTQTETFTIDPTTAKDFDDALSLTKNAKGEYQLAVHIADVAHYVQEGSYLDLEAIARSNSTYFPDSCVPMLPEELSNNLCSLKPQVIRLTISVCMRFSPQGTLLHSSVQRGFIKSKKRFTYEEAKEVLDGKKKSPHYATLQLMVELCLLLKQQRHARGSIDFSLPETVLLFDDKKEPINYRIIEYDITHQLVEEFMLKANEVVAKFLQEKEIPLIFRVHEEPSSENKEEFFSMARSLGFSLSEQPSPKELQTLFLQAKETPYLQQLSVAFIRSMRLAIYSSENIGHYGLALQEYCHFTSPIRRYPDLIIQRLLFGEHTAGDLSTIAKSCSEKERLSFKAENNVKTLKKLRLLYKWFTEDPKREYLCCITKIKPFMLFFELSPLGIEGSLHVSELGQDYFVYQSSPHQFIGRHTNKQFTIGSPITVQLQSIDLLLLETTWSIPQKRSKKTFRRGIK